MGTRGFVGVVIDDTEKLTYNHSDSYPGGLGLDVLVFLRHHASNLEPLTRRARELRVVTDDSQASDEDIEQLKGYADLGVSTRDPHDWYVLLRNTQGNLGAILDAGVILDAGNFPCDSLFAEWGYVVDLDARTFEMYEGFQRTAHDKGRFAGRPRSDAGDDGYAPVALIASWPLSELPDDETFLAAAESNED